MSDYFPRPVLINLLSRLPAKTLLQFRCVCKSWCSLISTPDFITTHLKFNLNPTSPSQTHHRHELLRYFSLNPRREHYSLRLDDEPFTELIDLHCPFKPRSNNYFRLVGSFHGLICLSDDCFGYTYTIILWNPSIRKYVTLPKPKFCFDHYGPYMFALGFGVDPQTNDPKVVRVVYLSGTGRENYLVPPKVEVYALSTGKWKTVNASTVRHNMVEFFWSKAFVNGAVHWVVYSQSKNSVFCNVVLLFDMGSEVFREMRLPKKLVSEFPLDLSVAVYGDSISVFHYDNRGPCTSRDCEVWIMKEYGVVESWVKQFSVCLVEGILLGFRNNGELLVEMWNQKVVSYKPANKRIKTLEICGGTDSFHLDTYTESLVLLDAANGVLKKQLSASDGVDSEDGRAPSKEEKAAIEAELEHFLVFVFSVVLSLCFSVVLSLLCSVFLLSPN
ncbi:F-box/kelch-repeat protein At3g06240-like [Camellia sinensis]|uniref:F-box/kelch-repeat protein At3g06240-like n=1 Tax=Camellia sinensis TaxID=4442 RepID=UPI0010363851|nr:F-box/kelch-repeat protein At3g06240-like [Camellia sinensis]